MSSSPIWNNSYFFTILTLLFTWVLQKKGEKQHYRNKFTNVYNREPLLYIFKVQPETHQQYSPVYCRQTLVHKSTFKLIYITKTNLTAATLNPLQSLYFIDYYYYY
jgi:cytochrome oxidase assembly protein ShyY1